MTATETISAGLDEVLDAADAAAGKVGAAVADLHQTRAEALAAAQREAASKRAELAQLEADTARRQADWQASLDALAAENEARQRQAAEAEQARDVPTIYTGREELHRLLGEAAAATVALAHLWRDVEAHRAELAGLVGVVTARADTWGLMRVPSGPEREEIGRLLWMRSGELALGKTANDQAAAVSAPMLGELLRIAAGVPRPTEG